MRLRASFLLAPLGLFALLGCSGRDHHGVSSSYLVKAIAVSDVDANGQPDILGMVATDYDGRPAQGYVTTRLQTSEGRFAMPTRFGVGTGPAALTVAKVDSDGFLDLVAANKEDGTLSVRLADAAQLGFFKPAIVLPTPDSHPLDVAVGDVNGDSLPDIVAAASGTNNLLVFHQLQTVAPGTAFAAPVSMPVTSAPQTVAVADLDGNGLTDIAVATSANLVSVLLQTAPGVFAPAVDYPTGVQPVALRVADLNGDGHPDLLTANYGAALNPDTQGLSVLIQTSPGVFAAPMHYATGYRTRSLAVGDLDGDGLPDVAVANAGLPGDPGSVSVLRQDPAHPGALLAATDYRGVWGPMGVALGDMDGDGRPDLVLADGDIVVRLNRDSSPGTFGPPNFFYN